MRILHLLSQLEPTGAEAYALALANQQLLQDEVYIVSDKIHFQTGANFFSQPISKRSYPQRIKNLLWLRRFVRANKIEIIHAHSRAASWLAYYARIGLQVTLVSTVHGRQHIHFSSRLKDIYGDKVVVVCENLKSHLTKELRIKPDKVVVVRNGLEFMPISDTVKGDSQTLTIAGRTSNKKGLRLAGLFKHTIPVLLEKYPSLKIQIVGGHFSDLPVETLQQIHMLNETYGARINNLGFLPNDKLQKKIRESTVVVAAGRIAIETLWQKAPLFALGEAEYLGLIQSNNLADAFYSNFGDCAESRLEKSVNYHQVLVDLDRFFSSSQIGFDSAKKISEEYNIQKITKAISDVYENSAL